MAIAAGVSMNAFAKVICKSLSVEQVEPNTNQRPKRREQAYCFA